MAVTAAAAKAATTTNVSNGSSGEKGARRARVQAVPVEANGGGSFKASKAEERRRGGKKAESLEQQLPQQRLGSNVPKSVVPGSSRSGTISGRRGKGGDKTVDDDSEGQWVVVGSRGGPQVAASGAAVGSKVPAKGAPAPAPAAGGGGGVGTWVSAAGQKQMKWGRGQQQNQQQQRAGDAGLGAQGPPKGGGVSVVGWASESSPASAARVASAAATAAAGRVRAAAASAQSLSPLSSVPPSTLLPVVPTSALAPVALSSGSGRSSGGGNAWGVGAKGVPLAAAVNPPGLALTPALASNGTRPTAVSRSGSQRRRPGPGPGSVWGASVPTPAPVPAPDRRSKHQLGSFLAPPRTTTPTGNGQSSRPIGPSNRAGVIGPPQHAQKLTTGLPVTGNGSSKGNGNDNRSSTGVPGGGGSDGVVSGIIPGGSRVVPAATGVSVGGSSTRGPDKAGDGEALVENEKLVSFLMETGSILALAQRLEEEDEWRKPGASSASSGRG